MAFRSRVRDVATVELGAADERRVSRSNGQNSIAIGIIKQATANPLDVSRGGPADAAPRA